MKIANNEALALAPNNIDIFYSDGYMVYFTRTSGAISGFDLKCGWISNLKFKKIEVSI